MLGFTIIIYKQKSPQPHTPTPETELGEEIARWEVDVPGLRWLDEFVSSGNAMDLGGNGYPLLYAVPKKHILPILQSAPPNIKFWSKVELNQSLLATIPPDEWLMIEAWDLS